MIAITDDTCGGYPRIGGTRIEVFNIIGCLANGMTITEIALDYNLSIELVKECVN